MIRLFFVFCLLIVPAACILPDKKPEKMPHREELTIMEAAKKCTEAMEKVDGSRMYLGVYGTAYWLDMRTQEVDVVTFSELDAALRAAQDWEVPDDVVNGQADEI